MSSASAASSSSASSSSPHRYGLCKVVRNGKVPANKKRPSAWDLVNRAKWDAWKAAENKGKAGAMDAYIALIEGLDEKFKATALPALAPVAEDTVTSAAAATATATGTVAGAGAGEGGGSKEAGAAAPGTPTKPSPVPLADAGAPGTSGADGADGVGGVNVPPTPAKFGGAETSVLGQGSGGGEGGGEGGEGGGLGVALGSLHKKGFLLKQRDVVKTWRSRYFILEGNLMSYYLTQVRGGREGKREERSVYRDYVEGNLIFYYLRQVRRGEGGVPCSGWVRWVQ